MKVRLLENDKIIEVKHWKYKITDNRKVIIDQNKKVIGIVVKE